MGARIRGVLVVTLLSCERTASAPPVAPPPPMAAPASAPDASPAEPPPPTCPEGMVLLEPGETPQDLIPFCLGAFEVTVGEYRQCVDAGACSPVDTELQFRVEMTWLSDNPRLPINYIPYTDALAYCRFRGGRLPTEAEWLWAAGPGRGKSFPWGETFTQNPPETYCGLFRRPDREFSMVAPCEGGQYPMDRTEHGVYDMVGSLQEYVAENSAGELGYLPSEVVGGLDQADPEKPDKGWWSDGGTPMERRARITNASLGNLTARCAFEPEQPSFGKF